MSFLNNRHKYFSNSYQTDKDQGTYAVVTMSHYFAELLSLVTCLPSSLLGYIVKIKIPSLHHSPKPACLTSSDSTDLQSNNAIGNLP